MNARVVTSQKESIQQITNRYRQGVKIFEATEEIEEKPKISFQSIIEEKENIIKGKEKLVEGKDELIKELQKVIETQKQKIAKLENAPS